MKYLRQFMIILLFSFLGELLKYVLPFPVPASIYGLVLLFIALETRLLPLAAVKDAGKFMIEIKMCIRDRSERTVKNGWPF